MAHLARTMATAIACAGSLALAASHGGELPETGTPSASRDLPGKRSGESLDALRARQAALKRQLAQLAPEGHYIVVDTARNKLLVKRRDDTILDAVASTGSGTILDAPGKPGTRWVFDTPRGEFKVQSRLIDAEVSTVCETSFMPTHAPEKRESANPNSPNSRMSWIDVGWSTGIIAAENTGSLWCGTEDDWQR